MRRIRCPICGKPLMTVSDDIFIDFNLKKATDKVICLNCKRKIRYSESKRIVKIVE